MNIKKIAAIISEFKYLKTKEEKIGAMAMEIDALRDGVEKAKFEGLKSTLAAIHEHKKALQKQNDKLSEMIGPRRK